MSHHPKTRAAVFRLLRLSALPAILRMTIQRRRVTVILYHAPDAERFHTHLDSLRRRYSIISLQTFTEALERGSVADLPPRPLVITLDDGHRTNSRLAPVLEEFDVPVTIFLCAGIVGTERPYWFKHAPDPDSLRRLSDDRRIAYLRGIGFDEESEEGEREALSREELQSMTGKLIDFQSHTVTHPFLPACSDEKAKREIRESRAMLEHGFGLRVRALAYPNGDYTDREIELTKEAGYACAFTVESGFNSRDADPFRLKRIGIDDRDSIDALLVKTSGLWGLVRGAMSLAQRFVGQSGPEGTTHPAP